MYAAEHGGAFESGAAGVSWSHEDPPRNGCYTLTVLQSSGPPVSFDAVVAIGPTFTRVVAGRSGGKGSEVSACRFQLPFEGQLLYPEKHPGNSQMAREWWMIASDGPSTNDEPMKEGVVN